MEEKKDQRFVEDDTVAIKHEKYYMSYICWITEKFSRLHQVRLTVHNSKIGFAQTVVDLFVRQGFCKEKSRQEISGPKGSLMEITLVRKESCRVF